jgi:molybdenum cofactor biosynthesis enzyme
MQKKATTRAATASAIVQLNNAAFSAIASGKSAKGDALTVAQLAGTDF